MVAATTVMFAVQAGVRLYRSGQQAFEQHVSTKPLGYAMIKGVTVDEHSAVTWLCGPDGPLNVGAADHEARRDRAIQAIGQRHFDLMAAALTDIDAGRNLTADQRRMLIDGYLDLYRAAGNFYPLDLDERGKTLSSDEALSLYRINQWSEQEESQVPSPLWRIGGTPVNLAVDYFVSTPGAVSLKSPQGRALYAFLQAVDESTDFAEAPAADIAGNLLIAVLDTVGAHPRLLAGGAREQLLVKSVTASMTGAVRDHIQNVGALSTLERREVGVLIQAVGRAALKSAADTVLDKPKVFFGVRDAEADVISRVGRSFASAVFANDGINLEAIWTSGTLEKTATVFFAAVADNPSLIDVSNDGVRKILTAVAADLSHQDRLLTTDALPDLLHLVFRHSAGNIDFLWPNSFQSGADHLLVTASGEVLSALSEATEDGKWPPALSQDDLLGVIDVVFAEVVENPRWVTDKVGGNTVLKVAIEAGYAGLKKQKLSDLNAKTGLQIVEAVVRTAATHGGLLDRLPAGTGEEPAVTAIINAVLDTAFGHASARASWDVIRQSALVLMVERAMQEVANIIPKTDPTDAERAKLAAAVGRVESTVKDVIEGRFGIEGFAAALKNELENI